MENNIKTQIEKLDEICPLVKGYKNSKRLVRSKFFEDIQTELQAYLLGFYVADGSLNEERNTISVSIAEQDKEIIELYKNISPEARCTIYKERTLIGPKGKEIHGQPMIRIDISNKKLGNSLVQLGYGQRKTYKEMHLPDLPDCLIWHFIRGYFDGDGYFTMSCRKPNPKNREVNYRIAVTVGMVSKTKTLLVEIKNFLFKYGFDAKIYDIGGYYRLEICAKQAVKDLYTFLYKTSNFKLSRKYNKYNYYVNTEESQIIADLRNA